MLENVIIFDGKKIYAFFPKGEMYLAPFGVEYKQSEDIGSGITAQKSQVKEQFVWDGKAGIKIHMQTGSVQERVVVELETIPRHNNFTDSITGFHSKFVLTKDSVEQDVKIVYQPRVKYGSKGKLRKTSQRRWVIDPINPEVPEKFLILSQLNKTDHGYVKASVINHSPAQAIKRLIRKYLVNYWRQCRDDLTKDLAKQLIWEIWFDESGQLQLLKYNVNEPGTKISLNQLTGTY